MEKLTIMSVIMALVLLAGAALVMIKTEYDKNISLPAIFEKVSNSIDSTFCEERVYPMIVEEISSVLLLDAYQMEDCVTEGDTIFGNRVLFYQPRLGMQIAFTLRVNCCIDLGNFSREDMTVVSGDNAPGEIIIRLPEPTLFPVEIISTSEAPLYIRNMDNAAEEIAQLRQTITQNATTRFLEEAVQDNIIGKAKQSAEDTIRGIVEDVMEREGFPGTVRVVFGSASDNSSPAVIPESDGSACQKNQAF
jgi:hypothetical protein